MKFNANIWHQIENLKNHATVFQAEILAILECPTLWWQKDMTKSMVKTLVKFETFNQEDVWFCE